MKILLLSCFLAFSIAAQGYAQTDIRDQLSGKWKGIFGVMTFDFFAGTTESDALGQHAVGTINIDEITENSITYTNDRGARITVVLEKEGLISMVAKDSKIEPLFLRRIE